MGGECDQRRVEIIDQPPDGELGRVATNDPRLDLDVGPELFDGRTDDAPGPCRGLDVKGVEDVHEHNPGFECQRPLTGDRHDGVRLDRAIDAHEQRAVEVNRGCAIGPDEHRRNLELAHDVLRHASPHHLAERRPSVRGHANHRIAGIVGNRA